MEKKKKTAKKSTAKTKETKSKLAPAKKSKVVKKSKSVLANQKKSTDKKKTVKKALKNTDVKKSVKKSDVKKKVDKKTIEKKKALTKNAKKITKPTRKLDSDKIKLQKKVKTNKFANDNLNDDYFEEDLEPVDNIEFNFKGKEKDLEQEIIKEDDFLLALDDDDIADIEAPKDDDILAMQEFEESLDDLRDKSYDIFDGVSLDDSVRMYLKEIGQHNLLSIEQEKLFAKQKQEAQVLLRRKKMNDHLPIDSLTASKLTKEELKIIRKAEISMRRLIECNLRLVVSIAKKYVNHGLTLLDLISEGNLGLVRGIEKFDYKLGYKLSTYVTWWIRQAVSRALADQSKTIRIPVHMVETINKLNKTKKKLTNELGYEPSNKQIAKAMKMTEEKVEEILQIAMDPISLDKPIGDEEDSIVADFIADQNVISPETNAERVMLKEQIQELLSGLKEREKKVLMLRFGIGDDRQRTLEEVGKELNVTRERIRQIEDKALRKLKYRAINLQQLIK